MAGRAGFVCASLPDQLDRRRNFSASFSSPEEFEFVDSIDGRGWSASEADNFVSERLRAVRDKHRSAGKTWMNEAAVACALTHRDKLLPIAEQRDAFLCEDDAVVSPHLIALFKEASFLERLRQLNGPVLAHYVAHTPILTDPTPVLRAGKLAVYRLISAHIMSGACYYVSPTVAAAIRKAQNPVDCSADDWMRLKGAAGFEEIYLLHPRPCDIADFYSTIGYRRGTLSSSNNFIVRALRRLNRRLLSKKLNAHYSISHLPPD